MPKTINGQNYFNRISFNEACTALESGETITMYIDCIGHTRNNYEQESYKEALTEKYGDRLQTSIEQGAVSYHYSYKLKDFAGGGTK